MKEKRIKKQNVEDSKIIIETFEKIKGTSNEKINIFLKALMKVPPPQKNNVE